MTAPARKKTKARRRKRAPARAKKPSASSTKETGWGRAGAALGEATAAALRGSGFALTWAGAALRAGLGHVVRSREVQRVAAVAALTAGLSVASHAVRQEVVGWKRFAVDSSALLSTQVPQGLSERVSRDLARLPLPSPASSFDHRLVPFTAAVLAELDWVEQVESVRIAPPARLTFSLRTRRPVARVGKADDAAVLTFDAAVMDRAYAASPERLPRVLGIPARGRGLERRRALVAAVAVLGELEGLPDEVECIDLRSLGDRGDPGDSDVVLTLRSGLRVDWGRVSTDDRPHLPGESKRAALEEFLEGGVDPSAVARVSLRWDETTYTLKTPSLLAKAGRP